MGEIIAKWLYKKMENMKNKPTGILYNAAVRDNLQTLAPTEDISKKQKEYVINKLSLCVMLVVIGVVLSAVLWINEEMHTHIVDNRLDRNAYGEGDRSVSLSADDGDNKYDITVSIGEREYKQNELEEMSGKMLPVLEDIMLGDNKSLDMIEYDIRLVKSIEGYPFNISWVTDEQYIDYEGKLVNDKLSEPVLVELTAQLKYEAFELEHTVSVMVFSKAEQPAKADVILKRVSEEESKSRDKDYVTLPLEIDSTEISWKYKRSYNGLLFLLATPLIAVFVYYSRDKDLDKRVMERNEQLRLDYPEIVSSLALLIGAGMTAANAWKKTALDYKHKKEKTGKTRYAYEEMLITVYEMENGVMQTRAYERFGRRCRIPSYNKLSTMLSQNIKKGASNLPMLLKEEASNAFEERKHMARQLGEKAGTKLLVPMMLLLGMIMTIIMIPAFMGII